jgi:hypothetical protein
VIHEDGKSIKHYGTPRRSGRYPWGSGNTEGKRNRTFLDEVASLKKKGMSDTEIARAGGITTTELRAMKSIADCSAPSRSRLVEG